MFHRIFRAGFVVVMMLACVLSRPAQVRADDVTDALDRVPDGTLMVLFIPSFDQFQRNIHHLERLQMLANREFTQELESIRQKPGFDTTRPAVTAITSFPEHRGEKVQGVVVVPVTDYALFVQNMGGNPADEITTVEYKGKQQFVRAADNYAIVSEDEPSVRDYVPGNQGPARLQSLGELGRQYLSAGGMTMIFDVQAVRPKMEAGLNHWREMAEELGTDNATLAISQAAIKAIARDTSIAAFNFGIDDDGVAMTMTAQFVPGSMLDQRLGQGGNAMTHMTRLPDRPYLLASSIDMQHIDTDALIASALAAVENQGAAAMQRDQLSLLANIKAMSYAWYAPQDPQVLQTGLLDVGHVLTVNDGPAFVAQMRQVIEKMNNRQDQIGTGADGQPIVMSYVTQYLADVMQVEGVSVDQYQVMTSMPPELAQHMGPLMMLGLTNYSGYIAASGEHVVLTTKLDPERIIAGLQQAKREDGLNANEAHQAHARQVLPESPTATMFIDVASVLRTVDMFMMMFGNDEPMTIPQDLKPIAAGLSFKDHGMAARLHVPTRVIQAVQDLTRGLMGGGSGDSDDDELEAMPFE